MSFTSEEVNLLIYRYLQESGFTHSAFTFGNEGHVFRSNVSKDVQPGALISFLQKGLLYLEAETHLQEDGSEIQCLEPFSLIAPHQCRAKGKPRPFVSTLSDKALPSPSLPSVASSTLNSQVFKDKEKDKSKDKKDKKKTKKELEGTSAMEIDVVDIKPVTLFASEDIASLDVPSNVEVCSVLFNPSGNMLASTFADAYVRIWDMARASSGGNSMPAVLTIDLAVNSNERSKGMLCLDWSRDGTMLATGAFDGAVRIYNMKGVLLKTLKEHSGPIMCVKWNPSGEYLLSCSLDKKTIVWNVEGGYALGLFQFHMTPPIDADWKNNRIFATCSSEKKIYVAEVGSVLPVQTFEGHEGEVNTISWDPNGNFLASCSDDCSAKVWTQKSKTAIFDLRGHTKNVHSLKWSPSGANTKNPTLPVILATCSFDNTIRIWEMGNGTCTHVLSRHTSSVLTIDFSPDMQFLASGSLDSWMYVWNLKEHAAVKSLKGPGSALQVSWSNSNRLAACFSDGNSYVINVVDPKSLNTP